MRTRPALGDASASPLRLVRWVQPAVEDYRRLFNRVGAPWLWFSRLVLGNAALAAMIHDSRIAVYVVRTSQGQDVGLVELDFRVQSECEIKFFALVPDMTGQGHGRWLMNETLRLAWREDVSCVWLHTCTLDHPSALAFYLRQGFVATNREIETFPDPRLTGILPRDAAPHVPLIESA